MCGFRVNVLQNSAGTVVSTAVKFLKLKPEHFSESLILVGKILTDN